MGLILGLCRKVFSRCTRKSKVDDKEYDMLPLTMPASTSTSSSTSSSSSSAATSSSSPHPTGGDDDDGGFTDWEDAPLPARHSAAARMQERPVPARFAAIVAEPVAANPVAAEPDFFGSVGLAAANNANDIQVTRIAKKEVPVVAPMNTITAASLDMNHTSSSKFGLDSLGLSTSAVRAAWRQELDLNFDEVDGKKSSKKARGVGAVQLDGMDNQLDIELQ